MERRQTQMFDFESFLNEQDRKLQEAQNLRNQALTLETNAYGEAGKISFRIRNGDCTSGDDLVDWVFSQYATDQKAYLEKYRNVENSLSDKQGQFILLVHWVYEYNRTHSDRPENRLISKQLKLGSIDGTKLITDIQNGRIFFPTGNQHAITRFTNPHHVTQNLSADLALTTVPYELGRDDFLIHKLGIKNILELHIGNEAVEKRVSELGSFREFNIMKEEIHRTEDSQIPLANL